ncbi:MAG: CBS domain-containing protein [Halanaerobiaceae bacterium]
MKLRDIMTDELSCVNPDTSVNEAARVMKNLNVGSVPVCEGKKPVGIITDRDITIRNVADENYPDQPVNKIMSSNLVYGSPDMEVEEAARIMADNQIRRLPVVENGNLIGIVSLGDIAVDSNADMEASKALTNISVPSKPAK